MKTENVLHILIRTPNYLGDTIMSFTAINLLRKKYPKAVFTFVCPPFFAELFERYDFVEQVVVDATGSKKRLSEFIALRRVLRQKRYDLGVLFQNSFKNALLFKTLKIGEIIGFNKEGQGVLLDFSLKKHHGIHFRNMHYLKRYAFLVNTYLGNEYEEIEWVKLKWKPFSFPLVFGQDKPLIALFLGSDSKKQSTYPLVQSKQLVDELKKHYRIVLIGGDDMKEKNKHLAQLDSGIVDLTGKTSVNQLIDLIGTVSALITIDSAPMHIAAATDTPYIVLLGLSSSPFGLVKPLATEKAVYCEGNQKRIDQHKSIADITSQEIKKSLETLLEENENRI